MPFRQVLLLSGKGLWIFPALNSGRFLPPTVSLLLLYPAGHLVLEDFNQGCFFALLVLVNHLAVLAEACRLRLSLRIAFRTELSRVAFRSSCLFLVW